MTQPNPSQNSIQNPSPKQTTPTQPTSIPTPMPTIPLPGQAQENQDTFNDEDQLLELQTSFKAKKRKFLGNLLEFCIGGLLLVLCVNYLRTHPAEKASIYSGFEVIIQKVEVFLYDLFRKSGGQLKEKYEVEKTFAELMMLVEGGCGTIEDAKQIQGRIDELKKMDLEEFARRKSLFMSFARTMYAKIRNACELPETPAGEKKNNDLLDEKK